MELDKTTAINRCGRRQVYLWLFPRRLFASRFLLSPLSYATTTVTTTNGAFTEYVPASETMVIRTEANPAPLRYTVTKQTAIDASGAPVAIERISPGSQLSIQYTGTGEQLVASRIVVQKPAVGTAPVTTAPVAAEQQTTTTSTTRALTHDEKHVLKEEREHRLRKCRCRPDAQSHGEQNRATLSENYLHTQDFAAESHRGFLNPFYLPMTEAVSPFKQGQQRPTLNVQRINPGTLGVSVEHYFFLLLGRRFRTSRHAGREKIVASEVDRKMR
jgi:hypothetical protein